MTRGESLLAASAHLRPRSGGQRRAHLPRERGRSPGRPADARRRGSRRVTSHLPPGLFVAARSSLKHNAPSSLARPPLAWGRVARNKHWSAMFTGFGRTVPPDPPDIPLDMPLQVLAPPRHKGSVEFVAAADSIEHYFKELGLPVNPASRIAACVQAARTLHAAESDIDALAIAQKPGFAQLAIDALQLATIAQSLTKDRPHHVLHARAQRLLKDAAVIAQSPHPSPGRDTQFELYCQAACTAEGFPASALPEAEAKRPDFLVTVGDITLHAEAKRAQSDNAAISLARKASRQFAAHGTAGFVFLDYSLLVNLGACRTAPDLPSQSLQAHSIVTRRFNSIASSIADGRFSQLLGVVGYAATHTESVTGDVPMVGMSWWVRHFRTEPESHIRAMRRVWWRLATNDIRKDRVPVAYVGHPVPRRP